MSKKRPCCRPFVMVLLLVAPSCSLVVPTPSQIQYQNQCRGLAHSSYSLKMVLSSGSLAQANDNNDDNDDGGGGYRKKESDNSSIDNNNQKKTQKRKYKRKRIPDSEKEVKNLKQVRQAQYEQIVSNADRGVPSIFNFESLFPEPVVDGESVYRDLYAVRDQDSETTKRKPPKDKKQNPEVLAMSPPPKISSTMRIPKPSSASLPYGPPTIKQTESDPDYNIIADGNQNITTSKKVDRELTRLVEDKMYGYRRTNSGNFQYATSLMGDGAVQFRDGVRLANPLRVNADRLNYMAKKELQHGRVEEAQELYETALEIDFRDGRAYLGLSRCAQRRRDFRLARECLQAGIANSLSMLDATTPDRGNNPFLLQALGCLEERMGSLSEAESLYIAAVKSRPSHAAAWVSLAQLRTRKLGQGVNAGRVCYQTAVRELKAAGQEPSAHVYTAWANLEYRKGGDTRWARRLFKRALEVDPKSSAALLMLGVMETDCENWDRAQMCFDIVLKFDQRNSRVLQAYAIMETKRPDGDSRKAIELFERALKQNPRDAGVLQPYALYVAKLGDIDAARDLLRRATEVNKRHAAAWQAWGVLETRQGSAEDARKIFQEGIWACAQMVSGQSGGYRCARLWQAWGVLEARECDYTAARRCFSRALDADRRNIPAITAWAQMEEELGNVRDARAIFERALSKFAIGSPGKTAIFRTYELMEQRLGNVATAQQIYNRLMRETFTINEEVVENEKVKVEEREMDREMSRVLNQSEEVEVIRWDKDSSLGGEVWLNDRAIESKLPFDMKERRKMK